MLEMAATSSNVGSSPGLGEGTTVQVAPQAGEPPDRSARECTAGCPRKLASVISRSVAQELVRTMSSPPGPQGGACQGSILDRSGMGRMAGVDDPMLP